MGELVRTNSGQVLTALVTLVVAAIGVLGAEGGRRRRRLRRIREQLEVLALVEAHQGMGPASGRLAADTRKQLERYTTRARDVWRRRIGTAANIYGVAALLYIGVDLTRAVVSGQRPSDFTNAGVAAIVVVGAISLAAVVLGTTFMILRRREIREMLVHDPIGTVKLMWRAYRDQVSAD